MGEGRCALPITVSAAGQRVTRPGSQRDMQRPMLSSFLPMSSRSQEDVPSIGIKVQRLELLCSIRERLPLSSAAHSGAMPSSMLLPQAEHEPRPTNARQEW
jgi:hypothetical protein